MFNAVCFKVNIFRTCRHFYIPTLFMPCFSNFLKSLYNLYSLGIISFCILNIFLCEENSFLNKIILYLAVCFYVNKTENQFISVAFQFVSNMPYSCKQISWANSWSDNQRVESPNNLLFTNFIRQLLECFNTFIY